jgi:3-demethoxyubiquinol 3-hydroxylase
MKQNKLTNFCVTRYNCKLEVNHFATLIEVHTAFYRVSKSKNKGIDTMIDKLIIEADKVIKTLFTQPISRRTHPGGQISDAELSERDRHRVIGLMRVNHCGEVCAQALYQGQALTARDAENQKKLETAAFEETEHLAWTKRRIEELGGHTSVLTPFFYIGSFALGVGAGLIGDKWSLGFLEETEHQVCKHLDEHLNQLPESDQKSKAILEQMRSDEARHEQMAHDYGAKQLPYSIKALMQLFARVMKNTTQHI